MNVFLDHDKINIVDLSPWLAAVFVIGFCLALAGLTRLISFTPPDKDAELLVDKIMRRVEGPLGMKVYFDSKLDSYSQKQSEQRQSDRELIQQLRAETRDQANRLQIDLDSLFSRRMKEFQAEMTRQPLLIQPTLEPELTTDSTEFKTSKAEFSADDI